MTEPANPAAENRRRQLRRWIDTRFGGVQAEFIKSTNDGDSQINQGELSGLLGTKSFGERRARNLEKQAKMPAGYLDEAPSQPGAPQLATEQSPGGFPSPSTNPTWPFNRVSLRRLQELQRSLGHQGAEAMHDIDETLEIAVEKWERRLTRKKSAAA